MPAPVFYFDLGSPYAYLTAERIEAVFGSAEIIWQPILLGGIFQATGRSSWSLTPGREEGIAEVARRAQRYGLPPVLWPDPWPSNYLNAMRCATYADGQGAVEAFAKAAFRSAFVEGKDIALVENLVEPAEKAGLDPDAMLAAIAQAETKQKLIEATEQAVAHGVIGVPTVAVGDELFWGDDRLEEAAAA